MATVPATQNFVSGEKVTASKLVAATKTPLDFLLKPPRCYAYLNTAQSVTSGTWLLIPFDGESWDTDGMHSTSTNNSRVQINTSGQYLVTVFGRFASNATGYRALNLRANSAGSISGGTSISTFSVAAVNGDQTTITRTFELSLLNGDYLELFANQNSGGSLSLNNGTQVTGMQVRWFGNT